MKQQEELKNIINNEMSKKIKPKEDFDSLLRKIYMRSQNIPAFAGVITELEKRYTKVTKDGKLKFEEMNEIQLAMSMSRLALSLALDTEEMVKGIAGLLYHVKKGQESKIII